MRSEFDKLATALFGMYWGASLVDLDVLSKERAETIRNGGEPTLEERRALVDQAFINRASISDALRAVQAGVLKELRDLGMVMEVE